MVFFLPSSLPLDYVWNDIVCSTAHTNVSTRFPSLCVQHILRKANIEIINKNGCRRACSVCVCVRVCNTILPPSGTWKKKPLSLYETNALNVPIIYSDCEHLSYSTESTRLVRRIILIQRNQPNQINDKCKSFLFPLLLWLRHRCCSWSCCHCIHGSKNHLVAAHYTYRRFFFQFHWKVWCWRGWKLMTKQVYKRFHLNQKREK